MITYSVIIKMHQLYYTYIYIYIKIVYLLQNRQASFFYLDNDKNCYKYNM